ncbi:hypothetical protein J2S53_004228 [Actinopolyspora lacussalsi]|nr:hypothetical protein [Actinopolyspora lacussalsi]
MSGLDFEQQCGAELSQNFFRASQDGRFPTFCVDLHEVDSVEPSIMRNLIDSARIYCDFPYFSPLSIGGYGRTVLNVGMSVNGEAESDRDGHFFGSRATAEGIARGMDLRAFRDESTCCEYRIWFWLWFK